MIKQNHAPAKGALFLKGGIGMTTICQRQIEYICRYMKGIEIFRRQGVMCIWCCNDLLQKYAAWVGEGNIETGDVTRIKLSLKDPSENTLWVRIAEDLIRRARVIEKRIEEVRCSPEYQNDQALDDFFASRRKRLGITAPSNYTAYMETFEPRIDY